MFRCIDKNWFRLFNVRARATLEMAARKKKKKIRFSKCVGRNQSSESDEFDSDKRKSSSKSSSGSEPARLFKLLV